MQLKQRYNHLKINLSAQSVDSVNYTLYRFLCLLLTVFISGCADISYYMQSVDGHLSIIHKTQKIDDLLEDANTSPELKKRLELVTQIRLYAIEQMHLPESDSYTIYADLGRKYVLRNLFAAQELSIKPKQWCYPVVGCAGYRGYFNIQQLERFADNLKQQGYDIYISNVPAYSTLGWFDDPVLNTFINWPDYLLAGLIFHELSHQHVYVDGDTQFNESFAVTVQQAGVTSWLKSLGKEDQVTRFQAYLSNRQQVINLIIQTREELKQAYAENIETSEKRLIKQRIMSGLKTKYQQMSSEFEVADGFSRWFAADINNAQLASISTYYADVPVFKKFLDDADNDFEVFLKRIKNIAELPEKKRNRCMQYLRQTTRQQSAVALSLPVECAGN